VVPIIILISTGYREEYPVRRPPRRTGSAVMSLGACLLAFAMTGCRTSSPSPSAAPGSPISVVAAEDQWGSLASQLGGNRVSVTDIITNPNADPHSYEPTASDAESIAHAQIVIENGIGYDPWADRLVSASAVTGRLLINVGDVVGVHAGGNPHQWYSPTSVRQVIDQITSDYEKIDPQDQAYFSSLNHQLLSAGLATYFGLLASIKRSYAGTPVGASESIFVPMAAALGLDLLTPPTFLEAISEGTEPTASDLQIIDRQISTHQIEVYVYNSQNATPDVMRQVDACRAAGIPVTTITETLVPAGASFQAWQVAELEALRATLAKATGHQ
jgi:zinc/manganese transport system substrate-binding protein